MKEQTERRKREKSKWRMQSHKPHLLISPALEQTWKRISERSCVARSAAQHTTIPTSSDTRVARTASDSLTLTRELESLAALHPSTHSTSISRRCCSSSHHSSLHSSLHSRPHTLIHRPLQRSTNSCCETYESHSESSVTPLEHSRRKTQRKSSTSSHKLTRNCTAPPPMSTLILVPRAREI